jgi:surface antigen
VAPDAPSGRWAVTVRCRLHRRTGEAKSAVLVVTNGRASTGALAQPSSMRPEADGLGAGCTMYCQTVAGNPFTGGLLGQCTWYAAQRRVDLPRDHHQSSPSHPYGVFHSHAKYWYDDAGIAGVPRGQTPVAGALAVWSFGNYGHVGYVEAVLPDGRIDLSDYNANNDQTYNRRPINPSTYDPGFQGYIYGGPAGNNVDPGGGAGTAPGTDPPGSVAPGSPPSNVPYKPLSLFEFEDTGGGGGRWIWLRNPGDGSFAFGSVAVSGLAHPRQALPIDMNGDGRPDIVEYEDTDSVGGRWIWLRNLGDGTFTFGGVAISGLAHPLQALSMPAP